MYLFITEPAPSTFDEKPASEPMETDKPDPEPEPEVDASVEEVCIVNIVGFPFIQNLEYWYKKVKFYILFRNLSVWKTLWLILLFFHTFA